MAVVVAVAQSMAVAVVLSMAVAVALSLAVAVALSLSLSLALCRPSAPRCLGSKDIGLWKGGCSRGLAHRMPGGW